MMLAIGSVTLPVPWWLVPGWWQVVQPSGPPRLLLLRVLSRLPRSSAPLPASVLAVAKRSKIQSKEPGKCPLSAAWPVLGWVRLFLRLPSCGGRQEGPCPCFGSPCPSAAVGLCEERGAEPWELPQGSDPVGLFVFQID